MGRLVRRFDSFAGIESETDQDRAILIERFEALKLQLPWLYVIMAVTVVGVQLAAGTQHPWSFAPAAGNPLIPQDAPIAARPDSIATSTRSISPNRA